MLMPRRVKHRKQHHPKRTGAAKGGTELAFGDFGIQAVEPSYVTNRQIESARIAMTRPSADQEAGRDPDGFRQGLPGVVGREREARSCHVRAVRRSGRHRSRGHAQGDAQASDEVPLRLPRGW